MDHQEKFDVAILGSGLGGSILAAILGRQGFRVLLLEKGTHPRFAIGEAMLPQSSMLLWILGERFDVPEIQHLSSTERILEHVTPTCGCKKTIGFLYHEVGERQSPEKAHLLVPPATPLVSESHLFRQEVDLYMVNAAVKYGAVYRDKTDVQEVDFHDDGVVLRTETGEEFHARYLVDGSGHKSLVAEKFGLRKADPELLTHSRTIFTHMIGVKRYDDTIEESEKLHLSRNWYEGTLHHVFEGGWFWIIPFDNVEGSDNPLCSIGLTLDMRKYPHRGVPPRQEFDEIVARYPSIAAHLEGAEAVRPWVGTGRLQYSSTDCAGDRYFLMAHAYGFIDALYSKGLISTFETLHALAPRLIDALRADDFSLARFEYPRRLQAAMLQAADRMVFNSYRSFGDYATWNAWVRVWLANILFGDLRLFRICIKYLNTGDKSLFANLDEDPLPMTCPPGMNPLEDLQNFGESLLDRMDAGEMTPQQVAEGIFQMLSQMPLPPVHQWGNPAARSLDFLPEKLMRMIGWGKMEAPEPIQRLFDFDPSVLGGPPPAPAPEPVAVPAVA
ncbi:MAG: NAD(P)/FAD-dependent oxidoreductase [Acidobacteria bacterium]|nr:NAD(P)/FAD-dependent oxidoreductase [Acidobacteriota bacterium]